MITLNGTVQRTFSFPADPLTTLVYFSDLSRVARLLPHISVVETYSAEKVRIRFQTVELGAYTINIYCDLELQTNPDSYTIIIRPLAGCEEVEANATLNATTGYGYYSSTARLAPAEDGTTIFYQFQFQSKLTRPRGLRMVPKRVVDRIAQSISSGRVQEIADGFMESALEAFDDLPAGQASRLVEEWLAARGLTSAEANQFGQKS
ncbi:DUF1997 domain-containing protein [Promineifilum sp.]|uniref:DUF1997 domain-containing protein n=1 Tax=Promineifilum sp. TaxID=2664178 RepID=UPI0035B30AAB